MDDILKRIYNEKALVEKAKKVGLAGWSSTEIQGGTLYRFVFNDGSYEEAVNVSRTNRQKLRIEEWSY